MIFSYTLKFAFSNFSTRLGGGHRDLTVHWDLSNRGSVKCNAGMHSVRFSEAYKIFGIIIAVKHLTQRYALPCPKHLYHLHHRRMHDVLRPDNESKRYPVGFHDLLAFAALTTNFTGTPSRKHTYSTASTWNHVTGCASALSNGTRALDSQYNLRLLVPIHMYVYNILCYISGKKK